MSKNREEQIKEFIKEVTTPRDVRLTSHVFRLKLSKALDIAERRGIESVKSPEYDHSKCPLPKTCIGYMNAESDLDHIKEDLIDKLKLNHRKALK